MNNKNSPQLPLGLMMEMAQDLDASEYFASLDNSQKQEVINKTSKIKSKQQMKAYVNSKFSDNVFNNDF